MPAPPKIPVDELVRLAALGHDVGGIVAEFAGQGLRVHRTSVRRALDKLPAGRVVQERVAIIKRQERARAERERRHAAKVQALREPRPEQRPPLDVSAETPKPPPRAEDVTDPEWRSQVGASFPGAGAPGTGPRPVPDSEATDPSYRPTMTVDGYEEQPVARRRRRIPYVNSAETTLASPLDQAARLERGREPYGLAAFRPVASGPDFEAFLDANERVLVARDPTSSRVYRIDPSLRVEYERDGFVVS